MITPIKISPACRQAGITQIETSSGNYRCNLPVLCTGLCYQVIAGFFSNYYLLFIFIILFSPCRAYSATDNITLSTYYPAPLGSYDTFRLVPKTTGNDYTGSCDNGTLYVNSSGDIQFCKNLVWGPIGGGGSSPSDLWQAGNYNNIYLNTSYNKVGIGNSMTSPPFSLSVGGDGGIYALGALNSTTISAPPFPSRNLNKYYQVFEWYPKKSAFHVGEFSGGGA